MTDKPRPPTPFAPRQGAGEANEYVADLFAQQKGRCAICGREAVRLQRDHDHRTGDIRALLCASCNVALGLLGDSAVVVQAAADYLRYHADAPSGVPYVGIGQRMTMPDGASAMNVRDFLRGGYKDVADPTYVLSGGQIAGRWFPGETGRTVIEDLGGDWPRSAPVGVFVPAPRNGHHIEPFTPAPKPSQAKKG